MARRMSVYADTNVLFPYYMSDLLLWLASDGVIRSRLPWRDEISHDRNGFPVSALEEAGIRVTGVDEFLCVGFESLPDEVLSTVVSRVNGFNRPRMTLDRYVHILSRTAPRFAELIAVHEGAGLSGRSHFTRFFRNVGVLWSLPRQSKRDSMEREDFQ